MSSEFDDIIMLLKLNKICSSTNINDKNFYLDFFNLLKSDEEYYVSSKYHLGINTIFNKYNIQNGTDNYNTKYNLATKMMQYFFYNKNEIDKYINILNLCINSEKEKLIYITAEIAAAAAFAKQKEQADKLETEKKNSTNLDYSNINAEIAAAAAFAKQKEQAENNSNEEKKNSTNLDYSNITAEIAAAVAITSTNETKIEKETKTKTEAAAAAAAVAITSTNETKIEKETETEKETEAAAAAAVAITSTNEIKKEEIKKTDTQTETKTDTEIKKETTTDASNLVKATSSDSVTYITPQQIIYIHDKNTKKIQEYEGSIENKKLRNIDFKDNKMIIDGTELTTGNLTSLYPNVTNEITDSSTITKFFNNLIESAKGVFDDIRK